MKKRRFSNLTKFNAARAHFEPFTHHEHTFLAFEHERRRVRSSGGHRRYVYVLLFFYDYSLRAFREEALFASSRVFHVFVVVVMEFERRSASSPVMNTNEIPIKLPERYASRRRQTRVIREDDINDELILERRREEYTSFFLSFVYEFRSVKRTAGKQNRTRNKCLRRLCCVYFSLSFGLFRCEETERRRLRRSFSLVVPRLRRSRNVSFVLTTRFYSNT